MQVKHGDMMDTTTEGTLVTSKSEKVFATRAKAFGKRSQKIMGQSPWLERRLQILLDVVHDVATHTLSPSFFLNDQ